MRCIRRPLSLGGRAVAVLTLCCLGCQPAQPEGNLRGICKHLVFGGAQAKGTPVPSSEPAAGAQVSVYDATGRQLLAQTKADARGHFSLTLAPGRYRVQAGGVPGRSGEPQEVEVRAGQTTELEFVFEQRGL